MSDELRPVHHTSAAVPARTELKTLGVAELSDADIEHLAEAMTRVWIRSNRFGFLGVLVPLCSCTGLSMAWPEHVGAIMPLSFLVMLVASFVSTIAHTLSMRGINLEIESLGYDKETMTHVRAAYQSAISGLLPRITRRQKLDACRRRLRAARDPWRPRGGA